MTDQRGGVAVAATASSSAAVEDKPLSSPASASDKPEIAWAFIDCPIDTLVELIAHMLDLLCQHNDQVVLTPDALTRFHSRAPPNITVIDYLRRIVKYTNSEVSSERVFHFADVVENTSVVAPGVHRPHMPEPPIFHTVFINSSSFPHRRSDGRVKSPV